jgi:uncharacterized UBP type Zn finger protein
MSVHCKHLKSVMTDAANASGCEECLAIGDTWLHLRLCRTCGHVGCCDDSKNKHATKHFHSTHHPIITSLEPGETWSWCYVDSIMMEL